MASLIILPILTRKLGVEAYGELSFSLAIVGYLGFLVEWGYAAIPTRQVAIFKDDLYQRSRIFWNVLLGKMLLMSCAAFLLGALQFLDLLDFSNPKLLWVSFGMVVATGLAPNFFFQGLERLELPFAVNVGFRFLSIPFVFLYVNDASDVISAQSIISLALLFATFTNLLLLVRFRLICWVPPLWSEIMGDMKQSAPMFVSVSAQGLFSNSLTIMLGYISGATAVGLYAAATNLYKAGQGLFVPLSQIFFPRLSHLFYHQKIDGVLLLRRLVLLGFPVTSTICALMAWLSGWVLPILIGESFVDSVWLFQLLTIALALYSISILLGMQLMVLVDLQARFTKAVIFITLVSLVVAGFTNQIWGAAGSVASMILFEIGLIISSLVYLKEYEPQTFHLLLRGSLHSNV